jgi:hypothetical protein
MSTLTDALEFINKWVQKNMPNHPAVMNPGLTIEEIQVLTNNLPFQLPREIYELYQWRNGGKRPFIPLPNGWDLVTFPSLEEILSEDYYYEANEFNLFPIFSMESGLYFILGTTDRFETAPIYCSDTPEESIKVGHAPQHNSLTSMMQQVVEDLKNGIL